jgi:hypothetical protein
MAMSAMGRKRTLGADVASGWKADLERLAGDPKRDPVRQLNLRPAARAARVLPCQFDLRHC